MALAANRVYQDDCIQGLAQIEPGSIDLAFADPPFNIGYDYDVYEDKRAADDYLEWTRQWMTGVVKTLKPDGTFWLAIGDEYAAELKLIAQNDIGLACRSWVIWYYTFGVNCKAAFSRSHTHLFHFVKDPKNFTFNADDPAVRIPSARQLVYGDRRANPKGRLPDNTWILRPQDVAEGFKPDHDTWYFPRVAGTFSEREGFHGCQMPEQLLGRIIRCCSNPTDIVLDPFGGSGTTFTVAKKLDRQWIGFELSEDYVKHIKSRLRKTKPGTLLDGAADPLASAPTTRAGRKLKQVGTDAAESQPKQEGSGFGVQGSESRGKGGSKATAPEKTRAPRPKSKASKRPQDFEQGIVNVYTTVQKGCSVDRMLADPELNATFVDACKKSGLEGSPVQWNQALLRIRKTGKLPGLKSRAKTFTFSQMDPFSFASEIAMQQLSAECDTTLDGLLCDPELAARFDQIAASFAPGYSPLEYRWAALAIRKRAKTAKKLAAQLHQEWLALKLPRAKPITSNGWGKYECPGVYVLSNRRRQQLYVGETQNVARRLGQLAEVDSWESLGPSSVKIISGVDKPIGLQSFLIHKLQPVLNSQLLVPDLEAVA